jgi:RNA ligase (TIGR02306 family)
MSEFKVKLEQLTVLEHPNADALELAQVGGFRAVVRKAQFKTGDYALYIPEAAVLPPRLLQELGLEGKLAGPEKDRVKAVRLRGELSQGIVCRPYALAVPWDWDLTQPLFLGGKQVWDGHASLNKDYADRLGITKWVPPVPVGMAGEVESAPDLIPWPDVENIKRFPGMFEEGEPVVATEKIHGSCFMLTYSRAEDRMWVSSKGQGAKNLALKESDKNLYWRAARRYRLKDVAEHLAHSYQQEYVALFGEVYGKGVQDLHYGADAGVDETLGFALFDIAFRTGGVTKFLDGEVWDMALVLLPKELRDMPTVPVLFRGRYDYDMLCELSEGMETVSGNKLHVREGLVVRPDYDRTDPLAGRAIAKFINPDYLTRKGGTEYE